MAEKRMFAKSIVLSDVFLEMPISARCLYFTLGMLADDDGFIGNHKSIMRMCGGTEDDLKVLLAKRYLLQFDSGVIVIKHWRMNNYLQNDRHKKTTYLEELSQLEIDDKGAYTSKKGQCIQNVYKLYTQNSIDKNRLDKNNKNSIEHRESKKQFIIPTLEEVKAYIQVKELKYVDAETFINFYDSKNWYVGKNKMTNWKSAVAGWNNRKKPKVEKMTSDNPNNPYSYERDENGNYIGG